MLRGIKISGERLSTFFAITPDLSIEERARRRLFTIFLVLLVFPLIIFGIHLVQAGLYMYGVIDIMLAFIFFIFIIFLRKIKNAGMMYRTILAMLWLLLLYWVNTGAIKGYASLWVLAYPPFALYLMGKLEGLFWTVLVGSMTAINFFVPRLSYSGFSYENDFISRHLFSFFIISIFTYNYESTREKYKQAMEDEKQKLKDQQCHLEELVNERTLHLLEKMNELEDSEKRYRLFADNITDMIWSLDRDLKFTYISPSVYNMYGYTVDEAMGLPHEKWSTPESYNRLMDELNHQLAIESQGADPGRTIILQLDHIKKDGSIIPVELKASFVRDNNNDIAGFTGISRNISDRIKAEEEKERIREQLLQAQKMEAVGTLAGGLAHDFNNFLGGIIGSFELISKFLERETIENRDIVEKYLGIGLDSSTKSADLIKQLLALSRRHEIHLAPVDVHKSLENIYELSRNSLPKSVEVLMDSTDDPLIIMGEPAQMEQVLLNLCINASHAMTIMRSPDEKQGGTLTIKAERIISDSVINSCYTDYTETGAWARISISDTGVGMDSETRKRIFEPFYSHKTKGSGTGLGLAISYNIVQKHGGIIDVQSVPGKGSRFTIYLPVFDDRLVTLPGDKIPDMERGSGTVLVIDDEIFILNIARGYLEQCGYDVLIAEGANEGLESYRKNYRFITAVLIDYSMPDKNGLEVFRELKRINSNVRAMLSSGMLDSKTRATAFAEGIEDTVNKPYTITELSVKIKKMTSG